MSMVENQAFGWLKNAMSLGNTTNTTNNNNNTTNNNNTNNTTNSSAVGTCAAGCSDMSQLVSQVSRDLDALLRTDSSVDLNEGLQRIKVLLYDERQSPSAIVANSLLGALLESGQLLTLLLSHLPQLPFEARKATSAIVNYLLVCGMDGEDTNNNNVNNDNNGEFGKVSTAFGEYVRQQAADIVGSLVRGHEWKQGQSTVDVALLCGSMLRSSLRHVSIYQWMLSDDVCEQMVYPFLEKHVHDANFDVSSDALETVRLLLTGITPSGAGPAWEGDTNQPSSRRDEVAQRHLREKIASEFLNRNYIPVIEDRINKLCLVPDANYMTRRMTLQILSTILLNRVNYAVMMRYIASAHNLVIVMCLLRDPSPHITLEAFQVFKIFVANPSKPPEVVKILYDNKAKLVKYLETLHKDREKIDDQFREEKALVSSTLEELELQLQVVPET